MDYKKQNTIHGKGILSIEVDEETGEVVSVWYNCLALPFKAHATRKERADEMRRMYTREIPQIIGIEIDTEDGIILRPKEPLPQCKSCGEESVVPGEEHCEMCLWTQKIKRLINKE
jgi:hypothetical protein